MARTCFLRPNLWTVKSLLGHYAAKKRSPFDDFVSGLPKNDLQRIFVYRILTHCDEHFESPGKLFSIPEKIWTILLQVLIKSVKNSLQMQYFVEVAATSALVILAFLRIHTLVHEVFKYRLFYYFKLIVLRKRNTPSYSSVLLSESMAVHLPNHVDELIRIVDFDVAKEMAQEVKHRHHTCIYSNILILIFCMVLDQIELLAFPPLDLLLKLLKISFFSWTAIFPPWRLLCSLRMILRQDKRIFNILERNGFEGRLICRLWTELREDCLQQLGKMLFFIRGKKGK